MYVGVHVGGQKIARSARDPLIQLQHLDNTQKKGLASEFESSAPTLVERHPFLGRQDPYAYLYMVRAFFASMDICVRTFALEFFDAHSECSSTKIHWNIPA